jgi:four helix bundle protein
MFSFEKLDVYKVSMEFYVFAIKISSTIPKGYGDLADQLRRAALSIPNNIAESTGRLTKTDKRKFLGIARGSGMESASILQGIYLLKLCDQPTAQEGRGMLVRIVAMLTKMSS